MHTSLSDMIGIDLNLFFLPTIKDGRTTLNGDVTYLSKPDGQIIIKALCIYP